MKQCIAFVIVLLFITLDTAYGARYVESKYDCPKSAYTIHPCKCLKATDDGLTIVCINTHLASLSVALANIAVEKIPIDDLHIERSHFAALFGTMFFNLMCRKITIRDTPIERIDDYTFYGVNETLQELNIHNSKLTSFPKAFKVLGKLTTLTVDTHNISRLEASAIGDGAISGKLERLHITNGNISDIPIEFLQSLRKLKTLDFHGNHVKELKKNQFKNLRDLEVLDISHNELTKLDSSHIADLTKLGWCNVSHNAISEITRGTFARNSVLKVLNMSNNRIKRLDTNSFRGMRLLRRLFLSDNLISDVGRGTFTTINRIATIDLARNQIKKVDYQMFFQLNQAEVIDLAENRLTEVQRQSFKDLYLTQINMSHNAIEKFEAGAFENCVNMTYLDLSYNSISSFARGTFDELSYATDFLLSFNLLTNMSAIPLSNMTGLKILNVSHNQIVDIPKNTFPKLYELHTIDLSHNKLTTIYNTVFQTLFSFRSLNMSWNELSEIKSSTFGTMPTLLELNINNNDIRTVARGALTKLSSLRSLTVNNNQLTRIFDIPISLNSLHLRNNKISEIPLRTWPTMNALIELDLRDNVLENRLSGDSFGGLMALRYLKLSNNGISIIPRDSFAVLSTLQYLYLDGNNITDVPIGAFGKLPVVFELNLHNNQITNISSKAFDGLLQLLKLNMSMNNIRSIPTDAFTGLVSLRSLDLSYNQLKKLDNRTHGVLDDCLSLEKINLSHNKFSFITKETFPSDPYIPYRLHEIDLSYNEMPVLTYDLAFGTHKVKFLNLSHNSINEIRRNVLSNFTQLETLDMSFNELESLESDGYNFQFPKNLTHLYISNNKLWKLPANVFDNLTAVRLIDIQNNSIQEFELDVLKSVKTGLELQIFGNPLNCDCHIRPLSHFYRTIVDLPISYTNIICNAPAPAANRPLYEINDDNLVCTNSTDSMTIPELDVLPDLRFQEIFFSRGNLTVRWIASPIKKDIAGFYVLIRNVHNRILTEYHLPYDKRSVNVIGDEMCDGNCNNLELCALAKDSNGTINEWFDSQCIYLPNDLERIRKKYNDRSTQIYVIHSIRKQIRAKSVANRDSRSSGITKTCAANIIIQCVFVAVSILWSHMDGTFGVHFGRELK